MCSFLLSSCKTKELLCIIFHRAAVRVFTSLLVSLMKTSPTMPCHWHLSTRSWSVCSSSRCCWIRNLREVGKGLQVPEEEGDYIKIFLLWRQNTELP